MNSYGGELWALFLTCLLGAFGLLFWLARKGDIWAVGVFVAIWTIICVLIGAAIVTVIVIRMQSKQTEDFVLNARENLAIAQQQQRLQNMQSESLMKQLSTASKLPEPSQQYGLIIDQQLDDFADFE